MRYKLILHSFRINIVPNTRLLLKNEHRFPPINIYFFKSLLLLRHFLLNVIGNEDWFQVHPSTLTLESLFQGVLNEDYFLLQSRGLFQ